jgi:hypothetical protein
MLKWREQHESAGALLATAPGMATNSVKGAGSVVDHTTIPSAYSAFLESKMQLDGDFGFSPTILPDALFPFQRSLVDWSVRKGRAALFADTGLGKTVMELVWAQNVYQHTGKPVLILTPLAVAGQMVREAERFGIEAHHARRGDIQSGINIANYERLHLFNTDDFAGVVCDESSCIKDAKTQTKAAVVAFMRKRPYRLLATATPAPNDYPEFGTSSEALGHLGFMEMLERFFKNDQNNSETARVYGKASRWRFKGHAEEPFWRWLASWARAVRKPSDLGFDDGAFNLPPLIYRQHTVTPRTVQPGVLFDLPAAGFFEVKQERKRTLAERCELAAALANDTPEPVIVWCYQNAEGDLLERLIPDAVQVSGNDSDDEKEAKLWAFANGTARVLITKPVIGAWGLNFQHCNRVVMFPDYSFEQHYQAVRRCWRFGQTRPVTVDLVTTPGEADVLERLERKADQAETMFANLVEHMNAAIILNRRAAPARPMELPSFLANTVKAEVA